ncbi:hypothetical protein MAR_008435 [Mya arenaria]|uniref:Uncharacterized protein n=1 Tax=Mya arenaria TaxID=6604 RepID=A0ABY7DYK5_MYAAR|nr:hypothetical protein MAR_008435 [Mya arenaria]
MQLDNIRVKQQSREKELLTKEDNLERERRDFETEKRTGGCSVTRRAKKALSGNPKATSKSKKPDEDDGATVINIAGPEGISDK